MFFSLSREQLHKLIDANWNETSVHPEDKELQKLLGGCREWNFELVCCNYFVAQILDQKLKRGEDIQNLNTILKRILNIHEEINLTIEEFDERFIRYLYENIRNKKLSLEDNLIDIRNRFDRQNYG